jgi:hypothetical protein
MIRFERSAANRNDWKGKIGEAHGHLASPGGATEDAEPIPLAAWATSPKPNYLRLGLASLVHRGRTLSCCTLADGNPQPNLFFFWPCNRTRHRWPIGSSSRQLPGNFGEVASNTSPYACTHSGSDDGDLEGSIALLSGVKTKFMLLWTWRRHRHAVLFPFQRHFCGANIHGDRMKIKVFVL